MTLVLGRKGFVGLAKETTPGVPVSPTAYVQFIENTLKGVHEPLGDNQAYGIRDQQYGSVQGKKHAEGSISAYLDNVNIGYFLHMALGSVVSANVAGGVYEHTFTRNDSNQPQTYSLVNDRDTDQELMVYGVVSALTIQVSDGLATFSADMMARFPVTSTSGVQTVTSGIQFSFKDYTVKFGDTVTAAQDSATVTKLLEFELSINNNPGMHYRSGSQDVDDISVGEFVVEGRYRVFFENTDERDKYYNLTKKAMVVEFNGRGIGSGLTERLRLRVHQMRVNEWNIETGVSDFYAVECIFMAEYNAANAKTFDALLRNLKTSY